MSMLLHLVSAPMRGGAQYTQFRIEYSVLKSEDCTCFAPVRAHQRSSGLPKRVSAQCSVSTRESIFIQRLESSQSAQTTAREVNFAQGSIYIGYIRLLGGYSFETHI